MDGNTYAWRSRLSRAFTQRLYIIHDQSRMTSDTEFHFKVMGNTDNEYDVVIDASSVYCSCPDHSTRGNLCKHLMFIMIRAIGMKDQDVQRQYEDAFETNEQTLEHCKRFFSTREEASLLVTKEEEQRKPIEEDDDCPICYESFKDTAKEPTVWCKAACGKSIHQSCFVKWRKSRGGATTCVYCRAVWK